MRINSITIKNFRGFANRTFEFDSKMNVVLGDNTKGKTTLLHAVQIALGGCLQSMSQLPKNQSSAYRRNIKSTDIPKVYDDSIEDFKYTSSENPDIAVNSSIHVFGKKQGVPFCIEKDIKWHREFKSGTTVHSKENVGELMDIVNEMEGYRLNSDIGTDVVFPILLAFGADRIDNNYKKQENSSSESRLEKAYKYALAETVDFKSAIAWYCNFNSKGKKSPEEPGTDIAFEKALETAAKITNIAREEGNRGLWADVKVTGDEKATRLKYEMMSSGFKAMVNMVAEIAYRCIMLNRWLGEDAVKKTPGVVLIDEVDLYLHPHWQQHVLVDLQEAFPEIQFIVSSHSPFIVQSVERQNIISLDGYIGDSSPNMRSIEDISVTEMNMDSSRSPKYTLMLQKAEQTFSINQGR